MIDIFETVVLPSAEIITQKIAEATHVSRDFRNLSAAAGCCGQKGRHQCRIAPQQQSIDVDCAFPTLMLQNVMFASLQGRYAIAMALAARHVAPTCSKSNVVFNIVIPIQIMQH